MQMLKNLVQLHMVETTGETESANEDTASKYPDVSKK
jgi:hypothetical protein